MRDRGRERERWWKRERERFGKAKSSRKLSSPFITAHGSQFMRWQIEIKAKLKLTRSKEDKTKRARSENFLHWFLPPSLFPSFSPTNLWIYYQFETSCSKVLKWLDKQNKSSQITAQTKRHNANSALYKLGFYIRTAVEKANNVWFYQCLTLRMWTRVQVLNWMKVRNQFCLVTLFNAVKNYYSFTHFPWFYHNSTMGLLH